MASDISFVVVTRLAAASALMYSDFLSFLNILLRWPSSTDMNALEGIRNCRIVASSEGRKADRTSDVFALSGFPSPAKYISFEVQRGCTQRKRFSSKVGCSLEAILIHLEIPSKWIESRLTLLFQDPNDEGHGS